MASFFIRLTLGYGLLAAGWLIWGEGYAALFRAGGQMLFGSFGSHGVVRFRPLQGERVDTEILLSNRRHPGGFMPLRNSSRFVGYVPTAFLLALLAATPMPWSRRFRTLLWGLFLVNAFVVARLALTLVWGFSQDNPVALFAWGPFGQRAVELLFSVFAAMTSASYVVPLLIWLPLGVGRGDRGVRVHAGKAQRA